MSTGIIFDSPNDDGTCPSDPDIAGIGVVVAFNVAALATTAASIAAAFLDGAVMDEKAFLPLKLKSRLNHGLDNAAIKKRIFYRLVLDRLILSFADQQLITGFTLVLTGYIKLALNLQGAHFTLIVYLSCLSSSSHLASVITLRKYFDAHRAIGILRVWLIGIFAVLLVVSLIAGQAYGPFFAALHYILKGTRVDFLIRFIPFEPDILSALPILWLFWTAIIQLLPDIQSKLKHWLRTKAWVLLKKWSGLGFVWSFLQSKLHENWCDRIRMCFWTRTQYLLFLSPCTIFVLQVVFALLSLGLALAQKFAKPSATDISGGNSCTLNGPSENTMGFGQTLAVLLLLQPFLSAFETYKEEQKAMVEEEERCKNAQAQTSTVPPTPAGSSNAAAADEHATQVLGGPALSAAMTNTPQPSPSTLDPGQQHAVSNIANLEAQQSLLSSPEADIADSPLSPRRIDTEMRVGIDLDEASEFNPATTTATAIELGRFQPVSRRGTGRL